MTDRNWTRHIDAMSKLREAIYLRSYANTDPLQSYTNEGYDMFQKMLNQIAADVTSALFRVQLRINPAAQAQPAVPSAPQAVGQITPTKVPASEALKGKAPEQDKPKEPEAPAYVKRPGEESNSN